MTLTAKQVIEAARDEHASFDDRRHPDRPLVRMLSRYQKQLLARAMERNVAPFVLVQETALPLADFDAGIALPAHKVIQHVDAVSATDPARKRRVEILDWGHHADPVPFPSVFIEAGVLYLRGVANSWNEYGQLRVFYVAEPVVLTAPASTFILPDSAESALISRTAAYMAQRGHADEQLPAADAAFFATRAAGVEADWLDEIARQRHVQLLQTREVF